MKVTSYLTGFLTAYLTSFLLLYGLTDLSLPLLLGIPGCVGASAGFVTVILRPIAFLLLAFQASAAIGCLIVTILSALVGTVTLTQLCCIMAVSLTVLVILSLWPCACKNMVIVNTAVISGVLALCFLDAYINMLRIVSYVASVLTLYYEDDEEICDTSWALMAVWPLLTLSGITLQIMFTARGVKHSHGKLEQEN